jgi:hypothetical protein
MLKQLSGNGVDEEWKIIPAACRPVNQNTKMRLAGVARLFSRHFPLNLSCLLPSTSTNLAGEDIQPTSVLLHPPQTQVSVRG